MSAEKVSCRFLLFLSCFIACGKAAATSENVFRFPLYAGISGGYGSTTWVGLVPRGGNNNLAMAFSTPLSAREGGTVWGFFAGYEILPSFAIEANYTHFPRATVLFDPYSLFSFHNHNKTKLVSHTEAAGLMAKLMVPVPRTKVRVYASAGGVLVHRADNLAEHRRLSPGFGFGVNYHVNERIIAELAGNYTAGFGESRLNPAETYFPFLYSVSLRVGYSFNL